MKKWKNEKIRKINRSLTGTGFQTESRWTLFHYLLLQNKYPGNMAAAMMRFKYNSDNMCILQARYIIESAKPYIWQYTCTPNPFPTIMLLTMPSNRVVFASYQRGGYALLMLKKNKKNWVVSGYDSSTLLIVLFLVTLWLYSIFKSIISISGLGHSRIEG